MTSALLFALVLAAPAPPELLAELDAQWAAKTPQTWPTVVKTVSDKLEPHAGDFEADWRIARSLVWLADTKPYYQNLDNRSKLGQQAMVYADRARQAQPQRVEGHYYYAWAVGQWSLGISIVKALVKGAESMYTGGMDKAQKIDISFDNFGVLRMRGRFHHALPWPKRDHGKAIEILTKAKEKSPDILRGYVFLAEAYVGDGKHEAACKVAEEGLKTKAHQDEADHLIWLDGLKKLRQTGCKELLEDL